MADVVVDADSQFLGTSRDHYWGVYWLSISVGYVVHHDATFGIEVLKTTNGGATWNEQDEANNPVGIANLRSQAVWYDRETVANIGTKIHIAWAEAIDNGVRYVFFDTATDTFGTERLIDDLGINGASAEGDISITVAKSGRVYVCCSGDIDLGTENTDHSMRSSDDDDAFSAENTSRASPYSGAGATAHEQVNLLPMDGSSGDDDDIVAVVLTGSGSRDYEFWKFDASANSWPSQTDIYTVGSVTLAESKTQKKHCSVTSRHSDEATLVALWNARDIGTADLLTFEIIHATPTVTQTDTVLVDQDHGFMCGIMVINTTGGPDQDDVYVNYCHGIIAGPYPNDSLCFFKRSTDNMANFGSEQIYSDDATFVIASKLGYVGDDGGRVMPVWFVSDTDQIVVNVGNDLEIAEFPSEDPLPQAAAHGAIVQRTPDRMVLS